MNPLKLILRGLKGVSGGAGRYALSGGSGGCLLIFAFLALNQISTTTYDVFERAILESKMSLYGRIV